MSFGSWLAKPAYFLRIPTFKGREGQTCVMPTQKVKDLAFRPFKILIGLQISANRPCRLGIFSLAHPQANKLNAIHHPRMEMGNNPELTENLNGNHSARIRSAAKSTLQKQHMTGVMEPHANDILMGRGGKNNQHVGNEKFRGLARLQSERYRLASKKGKSTISRELVRQVRMMNPPGRFLKKNIDSGELEDVGDDVAREKASQVLRDAVSVTTPSQQGDEQESEEETVQREEKVTVSSEQKRPVSAPTVMATLPRRRSWEETERYSYETHRYEPRLYETRSYDSGRYDAQNTPAPVTSAYYPPVTPSLSSAKRLRYHSDAWDDRLVSQVQTSPIVSSQYRYRDYARPYASEPNIYGRDIYAPEARARDTNPGLDEFDLFNGKLLESDGEEE